jgi:5'-methylthioadenosine phosphorylase
MRKTIGVIGGSGLYQMSGQMSGEMAGLQGVTEVALDTPFGAPSDSYIVGELPEYGVRLVFLPRHGRGHRLLPGEVNYAANIHGLKQLGAEFVLSVSAVGSLREHIRPGHVILPDQFIDRTRGRRSTFFGDGVVGHVGFADPVCATLRRLAGEAAAQVVAQGPAAARPVEVHPSATHVVMEGPAFSTRAESLVYRSFGADTIGMTNLPEAKLAREAELCYATLALCTDYDCWHEDEAAVSVDQVVAVLHRNVALAQKIIVATARLLAAAPPRSCPCSSAVKHAIMTAPDRISPAAYARLELIIGRYIKKPAAGPGAQPGS